MVAIVEIYINICFLELAVQLSQSQNIRFLSKCAALDVTSTWLLGLIAIIKVAVAYSFEF